MVEAGGIPLGKTNLPDFALWWETDNLVFGRPRTRGISTGRPAARAAVKLRRSRQASRRSVSVATWAASIRLPAHYCGIVGLKPTHGLVPLTGHWPDTLQRFMHVGPACPLGRGRRSALSLTAGADGRGSVRPAGAGSPAPRGRPPAWRASRGAPDRGFRPGRAGGGADRRAGGRAHSRARSLGGIRPFPALEAARLGHDDDDALRRRGRRLSRSNHRREARRAPSRAPDAPRRAGAPRRVRRRRGGGRGAAPGHRSVLPRARRSAVPDRAESGARARRGSRSRSPARTTPRDAMRATIPCDVTGSPALAVPFSFSEDGLPIGVQLVGRRFEDERVLAAGHGARGCQRGSRGRRPAL